MSLTITHNRSLGRAEVWQAKDGRGQLLAELHQQRGRQARCTLYLAPFDGAVGIEVPSFDLAVRKLKAMVAPAEVV